MVADRVACAETTKKSHNEYSNVFTGIEWFKYTSSLQVIDEAKPNLAPPRWKAYTLQEPSEKKTSWKDYKNTKYWHH